MGDLLRPAQWQRKPSGAEVNEDRVLHLVERLREVLIGEEDPTVVQLAAMRLVQKSVILNYQMCMGTPDTKELLKQASDMAAEYVIDVNGKSEDGR